jgi:hypothetical protein
MGTTRNVNFKWTVNGSLKTYEPSAMNILTYCIPRVHISVTDEFMRNVLEKYFDTKTNERFNCNMIEGIDFVPIEGNSHFKQAFVYHRQLSAQDNEYHLTRISNEKCEWRSKEESKYPTTMNIVNRITKNIFELESKNQSLKVSFTHNNRKNFWILLPNRNPIIGIHLDITEMMTNESEKMTNTLEQFSRSKVALPKSFDLSVLEYKKVETGWQSFDISTYQLYNKLEKLMVENKKLNDYASHNNILLDEDIEAMKECENIINKDMHIAEMFST